MRPISFFKSPIAYSFTYLDAIWLLTRVACFLARGAHMTLPLCRHHSLHSSKRRVSYSYAILAYAPIGASSCDTRTTFCVIDTLCEKKGSGPLAGGWLVLVGARPPQDRPNGPKLVHTASFGAAGIPRRSPGDSGKSARNPFGTL